MNANSPPYGVLIPWCRDPARAGVSDADRWAALTSPSVAVLQPVPSASLLAWAGAAGRLTSLEAASTNASLPATVRSAAAAALLLVRRDATSLDLSLPDRAALLDGLVAAGVLTADDRTSLVALATDTVSQIEAWGEDVRPGHLASARTWIEGGN